jgi:hypothetical protein
MDKCGLCLAQKNLRALCNMLMKSWAILGFDGPIVCFRCNICDKGYNYKFNTLFFGVWCWLSVGVIQPMYILFVAIVHHGAWVLIKFAIYHSIEFNNANN